MNNDGREWGFKEVGWRNGGVESPIFHPQQSEEGLKNRLWWSITESFSNAVFTGFFRVSEGIARKNVNLSFLVKRSLKSADVCRKHSHAWVGLQKT